MDKNVLPGRWPAGRWIIYTCLVEFLQPCSYSIFLPEFKIIRQDFLASVYWSKWKLVKAHLNSNQILAVLPHASLYNFSFSWQKRKTTVVTIKSTCLLFMFGAIHVIDRPGVAVMKFQAYLRGVFRWFFFVCCTVHVCFVF